MLNIKKKKTIFFVLYQRQATVWWGHPHSGWYCQAETMHLCCSGEEGCPQLSFLYQTPIIFFSLKWLMYLTQFWCTSVGAEKGLNMLKRLAGRGSSVGRERNSWWEGPGFDSRCGRPLPTGWVGVSIIRPSTLPQIGGKPQFWPLRKIPRV